MSKLDIKTIEGNHFLYKDNGLSIAHVLEKEDAARLALCWNEFDYIVDKLEEVLTSLKTKDKESDYFTTDEEIRTLEQALSNTKTQL